MKLLHCISSPHIGGIERLVIELAIWQQQNGLDVSIMLDTREGQYYEYLMKHNIPILDSNVKKGFDFNPTTYKQLKMQFKAFDIIHLHNFSPLRSLAANNAKVKKVYTIHGLSKGVREESRIKYVIRESLKKHCLNKVNVLVGNSNYTLSLAKEHYGLSHVKSQVILNGIRLPETIHSSNNLNRDFTIGLVSRFTKRKRVDRLVSAFKQYKELGGTGKLMLIGDGTEFENIRRMIDQFGLTKDTELLGYKQNVEDFYTQFDLCVFPSEGEPFGLVAVEAYLKNKAVIAFNDSGGLKEIIAPLEPENIVNTVDDLANKLFYWEKNRVTLHENSTKRKTYAEKNFSINRMGNEYLKVYQQLFNKD